ncbi:DUF3291 domain-containing protein [Halovulum sp. GXIMD14793]
MTHQMHLAEFNLGILKYDWDDPRVADFVNNLDRVNAIAHRSPGFVWQLPPDQMETGQLGDEGHPRMASSLSVWEDVDSLKHFVWNTVHKKFYDRRAEWYDATDAIRLVFWWVEPGHQPGFSEGMQRFRLLRDNGPTEAAFDWNWLDQNRA